MKKLILLLCVLWCLPERSIAQFNYVGAGFGYNSAMFSKGASHSTIGFELQAMARPLRFLGIGLSVGFPISNNSKIKNDFNYEYDFVPQREEHTIRSGMRSSLIARFFLDPQVRWYFDVRLNSVTLTETFILDREEIPWDYDYYIAGAPEVNINYEAAHQLIYPGFHLGYMSHLNVNLYINGSVGMEMINAKRALFAEMVPYGRTSSLYGLRSMFVTNVVAGSATGIALNFGLGYYF